MHQPHAGLSLPVRHGPYQLDRARIWELPAIARLEAAAFPEPESLAGLLRLWCTPGTQYLVARCRPGLCAYFGFRLCGPAAHVLANATAPAHRRRGLASLLLQIGAELARRRGARWLQGEVRRSNTAQLRLLAQLGWRPVALLPRFFGNGEDAWLVLRPLDSSPPP